jgi:hypothetical protein
MREDRSLSATTGANAGASASEMRSPNSGCESVRELRRWNRWREVGAGARGSPLRHRPDGHERGLVLRPVDKRKSVAEQRDQLRQAATLSGQVAQDQSDFGGRRLHGVFGLRFLGKRIVLTLSVAAASVLLRRGIGGRAAVLSVLADLFRRLTFVSRCRNHKIRRRHAIFAAPRHFLLIGEAAAVVPALVGRCAAAGTILAREGARTIFAGTTDGNT